MIHHSINAIIINSYEVTIDVVVTDAVEAVVAAVVSKLNDRAGKIAVVDVAGVVVVARTTVGAPLATFAVDVRAPNKKPSKHYANILSTKNRMLCSVYPVDNAVVDSKLSVEADWTVLLVAELERMC